MIPRVAITGLGVVSSFGVGLDRFIAGLESGLPSVRPIDRFDASRYRSDRAALVPAAVVDGLDPDRLSIEFANLAVAEAIAHARLPDSARARCGFSVASTSAGWRSVPALIGDVDAGRIDAARARLRAPEQFLKEAPLACVAERFALCGPASVSAGACAAASTAIGWAADTIAERDADVVVAGGVDELTELVFAGFHAMRLLAPDACRPFSIDRLGLVLSEGAAFVVLESVEHATARGATILAYLDGFALRSDASHVTTPDGTGIERAIHKRIIRLYETYFRRRPIFEYGSLTELTGHRPKSQGKSHLRKILEYCVRSGYFRMREEDVAAAFPERDAEVEA